LENENLDVTTAVNQARAHDVAQQNSQECGFSSCCTHASEGTPFNSEEYSNGNNETFQTRKQKENAIPAANRIITKRSTPLS